MHGNITAAVRTRMVFVEMIGSLGLLSSMVRASVETGHWSRESPGSWVIEECCSGIDGEGGISFLMSEDIHGGTDWVKVRYYVGPSASVQKEQVG